MERMNKKFRRLLAIFAAAMYLIAPAGAWAETIDLSQMKPREQVVISPGSGDITLTGTRTSSLGTRDPAVLVKADYQGTIELDSVDIRDNVLERASAIAVEPGASPDIVLVGNNVLKGKNSAALNVPDGAEVRISGTGKLTATGSSSGAGIGGNSMQKAGVISIAGGHVVAIGGSGGTPAAGIGGGGDGGDGGTVTITDGIVEATSGGSSTQDIGKGYGSGTAGTTTITGGSVKATNGNVDNPINANGTVLVKVERQLGTAHAGKTLSFDVEETGKASYTYEFDVPEDGKAYLWVPDAFKDSVPSAVAAVTITATGAEGAITLAATATGGTPTGYEWQRAETADGPFTKIDGATTATYTDADVEAGKTYHYKAMPFGVFVDRVNSSLTASASALPASGMPILSALTVAPGTLTPAFAPATERYTVDVSYDVAAVTVTATANAPDHSTVTIGGTVAGSKTISLDVGENTVEVKVADKADATKSKTYTVAVTRGKRLIAQDDAPDGVDAIIVEGNLPDGIAAITEIPADATVASTDKPANGAAPGYLPLGGGSVTFDIPVAAGEGLGLAYSVAASTLGASFDNWAASTETERNDRITALEEDGFSVVYEYVNVPGKTHVILIGAESEIAHNGGPLTWAKAIAEKIVRVDGAGFTLNYVVTDGADAPHVSDGFIVLPDGVADGRLIDPIWFMNKERKSNEPTGSSSGVGCTAGAGAAFALALLGMAVVRRKNKK